MFLRHIQPKLDVGQAHPCVVLLQELWPVLDMILKNHGSTSAGESLCKCFKNAIVSYDRQFLPLAQPLMLMLSNAYMATGQPCYLWVASHVVRRYGKMMEGPAMIASIGTMFETMTQTTLKQLNTPAHFNEHPDGKQRAVTVVAAL